MDLDDDNEEHNTTINNICMQIYQEICMRTGTAQFGPSVPRPTQQSADGIGFYISFYDFHHEVVVSMEHFSDEEAYKICVKIVGESITVSRTSENRLGLNPVFSAHLSHPDSIENSIEYVVGICNSRIVSWHAALYHQYSHCARVIKEIERVNNEKRSPGMDLGSGI